MFGFIGHRNRNNGRIPIVITGLIVSVLSYFLMFINLPFNSNIGETDPSDTAFITSNQYLAVFTAFILGFSDSCFNTQVSLINLAKKIYFCTYPDYLNSWRDIQRKICSCICNI